MEILHWLNTNLTFLQSDWFTYAYGWIVFLNPCALLPQLFTSIRARPKELYGISIFMFFIFLSIQTVVALGAIKNADLCLFWSMSISAVETFLIITITIQRRNMR